MTTIPEDEPLDEDLKVIRPLNEVKNDNINYYQIIRNHIKHPERKPKQEPQIMQQEELQQPPMELEESALEPPKPKKKVIKPLNKSPTEHIEPIGLSKKLPINAS